MVEAGAARISPVFRSPFRPAIKIATLVAAAFAFHGPAAAEVTRTTEDGFVSRHEVVVEASPTETWLALISPSSWWRAEHTWSGDSANLMLTPQAGGCFCETIPEADDPERFSLQGSVEHMRVIQAYPEQALRMQGALGPLQSEPVIGILTIAISKVGSGTRIVWEYNVGGTMRYEVPVIGKAVDAVMGVQLAALGKMLRPVAVNANGAATPSEGVVGGAGASDKGSAAEGPKTVSAPTTRLVPPLPVTGTDSRPAAPSAPKPVTKPDIVPLIQMPIQPGAKPAGAPAARPAVAPADTPVAKPTPKPAAKPSTVDDAFGDLEGDPQA